MEVYRQILKSKKQLAILIDPDKIKNIAELEELLKPIEQNKPNFIFVGGSLITNDLLEKTIVTIKEKLNVPVVLFPGNGKQISSKADAVLLLSLLSGRNADYLIGQHVENSFALQQSKLEIIATGYILIESKTLTSVEYISNTKPIPRKKTEIIVATALAGKQLGMASIYLDAGSGAKKRVPKKVITAVKKQVDLPLIVGGGIKNRKQAEKAWDAGADIVVIGTAFEKDNTLLGEF